MLVLVHEPPSRERACHYAIKKGVRYVAMCNHSWPVDDGMTSDGRWIVRRERDTDYICENCIKRKNWREDQKKPRQLPCTEPGRALTLLVRIDGKALIHVRHESGGSLCWRTAFDNAWQSREGTAGEITCERCLKSAGLYKGHTPYVRPKSGKPKKDWLTLLRAWENGEARRE